MPGKTCNLGFPRFDGQQIRAERTIEMKLTIRRNQSDVKGLFGGHKGVNFSLYSKVEITPDERALVDRYKVGDWALASRTFTIGKEDHEYSLTVDRLLKGNTETMKDLADLQKWEEDIKESCTTLKNALQVMATFGGEEVIEI